MQVIIGKSIKALPNLRHLTIHTGFAKYCAFDLDTLIELESISISGTPRTGTDLFHKLARLYASSPRLTSVELFPSRISKISNLHFVFGKCNKRSPPHRLRHLGLHSCFFRLDKVTLPHLRYLKSLDLELSYIDTFREPRVAGVASSPDEIWRTFLGSGIHLEELKHDLIPMSLIDYLSSYSGLKKLRLMVESDNRNCLAAANPFFNKCLTNHVDTLEELILIARHEGPWTFCSDNSKSIAKCTRLKLLAMNVSLDLGKETSSTQWELPDDNVVVSHPP